MREAPTKREAMMPREIRATHLWLVNDTRALTEVSLNFMRAACGVSPLAEMARTRIQGIADSLNRLAERLG